MDNQAQAQPEPQVHIYGSGRVFIVVPVAQSDTGDWVEMNPVERVNIILGRSVVVPLAQALREAQAQSTAGLQSEADRWDGDGGRWWDHHLLHVRITWSQEHITFAPQPAASGKSEIKEPLELIPGDVPESKLATRLIEYLGERLEAT